MLEKRGQPSERAALLLGTKGFHERESGPIKFAVLLASCNRWIHPLTCRRSLAIFDVEMDDPSAPPSDPPRMGLLSATRASELTTAPRSFAGLTVGVFSRGARFQLTRRNRKGGVPACQMGADKRRTARLTTQRFLGRGPMDTPLCSRLGKEAMTV